MDSLSCGKTHDDDNDEVYEGSMERVCFLVTLSLLGGLIAEVKMGNLQVHCL